jgi:hypothetical protein
MANNNFDWEDALPFAAAIFGIVSLSGFGTISLAGNSLDGQFFSLLGETVTWGAALLFFGSLTVMLTNGIDGEGILSMMRGDEGVAANDDIVGNVAQFGVLGSLTVPILMTYIPGVSDFVTSEVLIGGAVSAIVVAGLGLAAYAN